MIASACFAGMSLFAFLRLRWRCPTRQRLILLVTFLIALMTMMALHFNTIVTKPKRPEDILDVHIDQWLENPETKCNGNFRGYANEFVWLKHARFDKSKKIFSIPCENEVLSYNFLYGKEGSVLEKWMDDLDVYQHRDALQSINLIIERTTTTFAVMRYEAHNLYHTVCEWFNVYLICELFKIDPSEVDILLLDDRPNSLMDQTWDTLFAQVVRNSNLTEKSVFKNLIWNVIGYESPLNFHSLKTVPYIEDFRNFFLKSFGINDEKRLDCDHLNITIIWRRDYISHPERKSDMGGLVHRKFQNEAGILNEIRSIFKGHTVTEILLEEFNMKHQLEIITKTDILFGMHGAGMSHVLFLPKHAAVFETFPDYWGFLRHFKAFARWRGIKYLGWKNKSPDNEFTNYYTRIPEEVIRSHMSILKEYLCPV